MRFQNIRREQSEETGAEIKGFCNIIHQPWIIIKMERLQFLLYSTILFQEPWALCLY